MDKIPFRDQYEALKDKQTHLELLMAEQAATMDLIQRRRFRLMLVYLVLLGLSVCVGLWVF